MHAGACVGTAGLILLDIMMEPYDGWDTLQSVRNNIQTQDLPIMILTGKRPTVEE